MRLRIFLLTLLATIIVGGFPPIARPQEHAVCAVSANYADAVNENRAMLIKLLAMIYAEGEPLEDPAVARIYYMMLRSTRQHHVKQQATLPACAQPINTAITNTLMATQDVIALKLAQQADAGSLHVAGQLAQTRDDLTAQWLNLSQAWQETELTVTE